MKVAFHLRRRSEREDPTAVFLETDRVEPLLELAARLGLPRSPKVHRVSGGFLVELGTGNELPVGSIRLRALAENLYLPVDADLVPSLLEDEARGLTRDRGLVFLPGGRVLGVRTGGPARSLRDGASPSPRRLRLAILPEPARSRRAGPRDDS